MDARKSDNETPHLQAEDSAGISVQNQKRRNFLKLLALGGGALVALKALDTGIKLVSDDVTISEHLFQNFKIVETKKSLTFYDSKNGEEILVIEKDD